MHARLDGALLRRAGRKSRLSRRAPLAGAVCLAASLLCASEGRAQTFGGLALNQLQPTPAGDPFFGVPSPFIGGHLVPRGLVMFDYAHRPLALGGNEKANAIVGSQAFLHLDASFALWDRLLVSAVFPLAIVQSGDSPKIGTTTLKSPSSVQPGDLRVGLRVRLFGDDYDPFQIALGTDLHLPTAPANSFAGEGAVRDAPHLLLGGRFRQIVWSATFGAMIRGSDNPSSLTYGGGAAITLLDDRLQIGPEVSASTLLRGGDLTVSKNGKPVTTIPRDVGTNAEVMLGVRFRAWKGLSVGAAGGPGITSAPGTPVFRALGVLAWSPPPPKPGDAQSDTDQDGVPDAADACPNAWGPARPDPKKNGCPINDRDEDGVDDAEDACPDQKGDKSADAKANGCPPDRDGDRVPDAIDACPDQKGEKDGNGCPSAGDADGDGIPDAADACPQQKGVASGDAKRNGCPPGGDLDGDGVPDANDACPGEKGPASADAKSNGCPKFVRVNGGEITTLEAIKFKVSTKDPPPIDAGSEAILTELRDVLAQHPEFVKVEVQGHTDNTGNAGYNDRISASRAEAVRKWLIDHGVAAGRLVAKGYGGSKPIADNKSAAGRTQNRRVVLVALEKK